MKKLTAEVARRDISHLKAFQKQPNIGLSLREETYLQALEIALPILEQQERACQKCGGTGMADSGGTQPWGEQILVECDCQFEKQERGDGWIEWGGGECPVPEGVKAEIKFRDGDCAELDTWLDILEWRQKGYGSDIIAYRIIPEQPTNQNGEQ
ncbi:MAG: hypothetical protein E6X99_16095 [Pantoea sp.]|nr:hypothetical protein [Pantoea sp.]